MSSPARTSEVPIERNSGILRVAVLGCGPAGLVAAHAASVVPGVVVTVFSKRRKSEMYGSQFLKAPIPGAPPVPHSHIQFRMVGTQDGYLTKIYGEQRHGEWYDSTDGVQRAWDIRATYDWLWARWWPYVIDMPLDIYNLSFICRGWDIVISTVPRKMLCAGSHDFAASYIWAAGDAPARGIRLPDELRDIPNNTIIRNGDPDTSWTRLSNTYGYITCEWPDAPQPPVPTAARVSKPLTTDCDCWPDMHLVGRYGRWDKDSLVHDVYPQTQEIIARTVARSRISR